MRRFPPPWTLEKIPGGFKVLDANRQSAYVYAYETLADADITKVLTMDEARCIASNIAKPPALLGATKEFQKEAANRCRLRSATVLFPPLCTLTYHR